MKEDVMFYYLRDDHNHPRGCVAMSVNDDGTVNRGVSLCSTIDQFDRAHARGLAVKRLQDALKIKENMAFDKYYGRKGTKAPYWELSHCNADNAVVVVYKVHFKAIPTEFERKMLNNPFFNPNKAVK